MLPQSLKSGATASTEQPSALTSRGRSTSPKPRRRARSTSRSQSPRRRSRSPSPRYRSQEHTPQQQRAWPELDSKETELFLQNIAEKVRRNGRRYEDQLRHDERNNADYAFFFDQSVGRLLSSSVILAPDAAAHWTASFVPLLPHVKRPTLQASAALAIRRRGELLSIMAVNQALTQPSREMPKCTRQTLKRLRRMSGIRSALCLANWLAGVLSVCCAA